MPEPEEHSKLCVIIVDDPDLTDSLITGFLEVGVRGATVVETKGMGQIVRQDMPIFAGLAGLFPETSGSRMILSAMPQSLVQPVFDLIDELVGTQEEAHSVICFTLPIEEFRGIRS
jgi:nitrogen regulatory protein P-II 1